MPLRVRRRRTILASLAIAAVTTLAVLPASAVAQPATPSSTPSPGPDVGGFGNQVVLVGRVVVPRGQSVGEVVVFSGRAVVEGIVRGDVVVVNGPITVSGQVSGTVVALSGSVRLLSTAQVGGDVLAHDRVVVAAGASVQGRMSEGVSFTLSRSLRTVAAFVSWLAVAVSTLLLGLLFAFVAPRGLERSADAGRSAPWASAGWGLVLAIGGPILAVVAVALVLGIPLGIGLLLSLVLLSLLGAVVTAQTVGRVLIDPDRHTITAFVAGWALAAVLGVIPYVSGVVYALSAMFGLGAATVAIWRARGPRREARPAGKHRAGGVSVPVDPTGSGEAPGL